MIIRVWKGRTSADKADGYERFLRETAYPDYGDRGESLQSLHMRDAQHAA